MEVSYSINQYIKNLFKVVQVMYIPSRSTELGVVQNNVEKEIVTASQCLQVYMTVDTRDDKG